MHVEVDEAIKTPPPSFIDLHKGQQQARLSQLEPQRVNVAFEPDELALTGSGQLDTSRAGSEANDWRDVSRDSHFSNRSSGSDFDADRSVGSSSSQKSVRFEAYAFLSPSLCRLLL